MSEFLNARDGKRDFRWKLLTTVSALALLAAIYRPGESKAEDQDADRPTIWIEFGGQLEHVDGQGSSFTPGFVAANPNSPVLKPVSPLQAENPPPWGFGEEGKIAFQPEDSDWVFSAAAKFGRSSNFKHVDHQTNKVFDIGYKYGIPTTIQNIRGTDDFADTQVHHRESHAIMDFSVGKDVGLGMFGREGSSVLSLGVRFAQFASNITFDARARPDLSFKNITFPAFHATLHEPYFHTYHATGKASRGFHGIGPSLSWDGSTPFAGNLRAGEATIDWGANAALLFGKQNTRAQHQESSHYWPPTFNNHVYSGYQHPVKGHDNSRSIIVPNVGAFAGASYRIENFKVSLGYRADFFFGAIDGGIDTRKSETLGFYGPFASVSVGLGG